MPIPRTPDPAPVADGQADKPQAAAFSFGDPIPVLAGLFHSAWNGTWHDPPISFDGLARALPSNPHHQSCITVKANILTSCHIPHPLLDSTAFKRLALDVIVFGNACLDVRRNRFDAIADLAPVPARRTRLARDGKSPFEKWFPSLAGCDSPCSCGQQRREAVWPRSRGRPVDIRPI